ncbi:tRNA (cytosine(34)-C(5))-methyltransferase, mitochondrial isoform X1 [Polypterus senegalus]|uniref:tRNA (cytosine(34)-C(5))-methyltransferase, mitochondrial isoform X1 n=1 Tax=Polypterus senegalus TaxID=55291 RepID=UPI00196379B6|nr:tRNA (cytosine(34)-C(5))-methyltransferase, mitochondrial isoform X1 [Polypterus senegalus]
MHVICLRCRLSSTFIKFGIFRKHSLSVDQTGEIKVESLQRPYSRGVERQPLKKQISKIVLSHFDQQYPKELGNLWESIRSVLLCPNSWQYAVLLNRFNGSLDLKTCLSSKGYVPLQSIISGHQKNPLECFVSKTFSRFPSQKHRPGVLKQYYLLGAASVLPVLALEPQNGDKILDMCSAPGGKSIAIMQAALPGHLHCNDQDSSRVKRLKETLESFIPSCFNDAVTVSNLDGRCFGAEETFDKVLVDAPCSNDRSWLFSRDAQSHIRQRQHLPTLQIQLLRSAINSVRPGGTVVYSTCTLSRAENENVVATVLSNCDNIELIDLNSLTASMSVHFCYAPGLHIGHLIIPENSRPWGPMYVAKLKKLY